MNELINTPEVLIFMWFMILLIFTAFLGKLTEYLIKDEKQKKEKAEYEKHVMDIRHFVRQYYPNHNEDEIVILFTIVISSVGHMDNYKLKNIVDRFLSKKESYQDAMSNYDNLAVKELQYLPDKISLEQLIQNDGEIPDYLEEWHNND